MIDEKTIQTLLRLATTTKWTTSDYMFIKMLLSLGQKPALDYLFLASQQQPSARYIGIITNLKYSESVKINHGPGAPDQTFSISGTSQVKFEIDKAAKDQVVQNFLVSQPLNPASTDIKQLD